ncbi:hypothetical protein [Spiroplasma sp. AdecLV25b]|uniref:hypothetical protein n=1 Tax=Spiroplasma sp. AdecLV25b TaxID=3027162 RepID=UPI0027DFD15F|nr:hypothetical protein [Spiroplasma sp. AdecLV25b]
MTFYLNEEQKSLIKKHYQGFEISNEKNKSESLFKFHDITIEFFKDKVIFQGPREDIIAQYRDYLKNFDTHNWPVIGNDEFGLDNYFGPIVVVSSYIGSSNLEKLRLFNIENYKNLPKDKFKELAFDIMKTIIFESVIINNRKYNQWTDAGYSHDIIKTWGQNQALVRMLQHKAPYDRIIINQYTNEKRYYDNINNMVANKNKVIKDKVEFINTAESKYLAVMCSTIISRYLFLEEIDKIRTFSDYDIPLGSGTDVTNYCINIKMKMGATFSNFMDRHCKRDFPNTKIIMNAKVNHDK